MSADAINITYIISNVDRFIGFEWLCSTINKNEFNLSFILLNRGDSYLENFLRNQKIQVHRIKYRSKKDLVGALIKTAYLIKKLKSNLVHTHFLDANIIGLTASKIIGVKRRLHTRHHSTFHHEFHRKGIWIDKYCNFLSTRIISISSNVSTILNEWEHVSKQKISLIHHGLQLDYFAADNESEVSILKNKYQIRDQWPVIGVISRYIHWKGIQFTIRAFTSILKEYPNALLILANASGPDAAEVREELQTLPPESYREIRFEKQSNLLYKLFDVFIHVPINEHVEAFGLVYIESLLAGVPSVFTISGVARDFIEHKKNALIVDYEKSEEITAACQYYFKNKLETQLIAKEGTESVKSQFGVRRMVKQLEKTYHDEYTRKN